MVHELIRILDFISKAFIHIWPYLIITIPIAVAVNISGASRHIKKAFNAKPMIAILLATFVGAFSPFCSCTVIPIISALLISGVPLPPVMAFWIASPLMDPEIFFLSVGTIGWRLAVWRLAGALFVSLTAGFLTLILTNKGLLSKILLQKKTDGSAGNRRMTAIKDESKQIILRIKRVMNSSLLKPVQVTNCCSANPTPIFIEPQTGPSKRNSRNDADPVQDCKSNNVEEKSVFLGRLGKETLDAVWMVVKFMILAFFLEALIVLYVPDIWITNVMGKNNPFSILTAAFLGVPVYTSNLSALPLISGLLSQGMSPAAALAFLISGPTTTLPAMAAVWTLVERRIFFLYISFALFGAVFIGYLFSLFN